LSPTEQEAFNAWKNADSRHAAAFERGSRTWRGLDSVGGVAELETMADDFLVRARSRRRNRRYVRFSATVGAAAAALVIGFFSWQRFQQTAPEIDAGEKNYRVLASSVRRTTLPDGSVAELNGASRIEVNYTASERRVRLVEGEAHFIVERNSERPFFVTAGMLDVRAVGTAFNVRLATEVIEVLVTHGEVKLETAPPLSGTPVAVPTVTSGSAQNVTAEDKPDNAP
jgi:transmembrane sensor